MNEVKMHLGGKCEPSIISFDYNDYLPEGCTSWYDWITEEWFDGKLEKKCGQQFTLLNVKTQHKIPVTFLSGVSRAAFDADILCDPRFKEFASFIGVMLPDKKEIFIPCRS